MADAPKCELCGEPMPAGEEMFKFHGYSGNCPKPPLPRPPTVEQQLATSRREVERLRAELREFVIESAGFDTRTGNDYTRCQCCSCTWPTGGAEDHTDGCLATLPGERNG